MEGIYYQYHPYNYRENNVTLVSGSWVDLIDAATGRVTGTIGYGPLNVGARAYADLWAATILDDTAAVNRCEAILQFITERGYATRQQIILFRMNNTRTVITELVDREFAGITIPTATVSYIKELLMNYQTGTLPTETDTMTPADLRNAVINIRTSYLDSRAGKDYFTQYGVNIYNAERFESISGPGSGDEFRRLARDVQQRLNEIRGRLRVPANATIDWDAFSSAYERILRSINADLFIVR
jgi:hypothetical protein